MLCAFHTKLKGQLELGASCIKNMAMKEFGSRPVIIAGFFQSVGTYGLTSQQHIPIRPFLPQEAPHISECQNQTVWHLSQDDDPTSTTSFKLGVMKFAAALLHPKNPRILIL